MERSNYKNSGLISCRDVNKISNELSNYLLDKYHYLGGIRNSTVAYGNSEGCCVFGVPRSRKLKLNCPYKIIELIRMVGIDGHKWSMSSLMAQSIKLLKKEFDFDVVITYSDPHAGHNGNIYRASNWIDLDKVVKDGHPLIFLDGKSLHPRTAYYRYGTSSINKLKEMFGDRLITKEKQQKTKFIYWLNNKKDYLHFFVEEKIK